MADITFDEIVRLADQLTPEEQTALAQHLLAKSETSEITGLTREKALAEFERRKALGLFDGESLYGKFAHPDYDPDYDLITGLHEIATEWEQELDEFYGNDKN